MYTKENLGLQEAWAALEAILDEASKDTARPVSVAIVDDHGETICSARMDGVTPLYSYMALKKARSAVLTSSDTRQWREFLAKRDYTPNDFCPEATPVAGGVVIVRPGEKVVVFGGGALGAIGVGGRTGDEDEELSRVGLAVLQKIVWG